MTQHKAEAAKAPEAADAKTVVRAKFRCDSVEHTAGGCTLKMTPVPSGAKEHASLFQGTPGGGLILTSLSHEAAKQFVPGKEYYIDFTQAGA